MATKKKTTKKTTKTVRKRDHFNVTFPADLQERVSAYQDRFREEHGVELKRSEAVASLTRKGLDSIGG